MKDLSIVLVVVCVAMLVLLVVWNRRKSEKFGILGAAAPYQAQLSQCITQCNRSDPNNRLMPQNNLYCEDYCNDVVSSFAESGIPAKNIPISDNYTLCESQCNTPDSTPEQRKKCISMCYGQNQVAQWCKELWCPYSLWDDDQCMDLCFRTWNTNNNQVSWEWAMSR